MRASLVKRRMRQQALPELQTSLNPEVVFVPALIQMCYTLLKKTLKTLGDFDCCLCSSSTNKKQCRYLLTIL